MWCVAFCGLRCGRKEAPLWRIAFCVVCGAQGVDDISPRRDFLHGVAECFLIFRRATGGELTAPRRAEKRPTFLT